MAVREADDSPAAVDVEPTAEGPRAPTSVRAIVFGIALAAVLLLGAGLGVGLARGGDGGDDGDPVGADDGWAGTALGEPQSKPDIVLTDTSGERFDLRAQTEGKLTVLFFGYTNCPDVCPVSLTTIGKALTTMPADVRSATRVVFVSVDPERDTPDVLRRYLDEFDRGFVGLTGRAKTLALAQDQANVPQAAFEEPDADGEYLVGHASQMIVYSPDGVARIVYPFGTRQSDWAQDLPRLAAGEHP